MSISFAFLLLFSLVFPLIVGQNEKSLVVCLNIGLRLGTVGVVYFGMCGYELSSHLFRIGGMELIRSEKSGEQNLLLSQLFCGIIQITIWALFIICSQYVLMVRKMGWLNEWLLHILKAVFLYCFLPAFISWLLGCNMAQKRRSAGYLAILALAALSNPAIQYSKTRFAFRIVSPEKILDWFMLLEPSSEFAADDMYGIPMEFSRWNLALLWLCIMLLLLGNKLLVEKRKRYSFYGLMVLFIAFSTFRYAFREQSSVTLKDYRKNGWIYSDFDYYRNNEADTEKAESFDVLSYDMELSLKERLNAKVTLNIGSHTSDELVFTLYHGLKVLSVCDANGEECPWEQDSDYLHISAATSGKTFVIEYEGHCGKYYSNRQGCLLPGYIAWYPLPGKVILWNKDTSQRIPYISGSAADFSVRIQDGPYIVSNLTEQSDGFFCGTAESVSLFGGLVKVETVDCGKCISGLVGGQKKSFSYEELRKCWTDFTELLDISAEFPWSGENVYLMPYTIRMSNAAHEDVVVTDTQLYLCNLNTTADMIAGEMVLALLPEEAEKSILYHLFANELMDNNFFPDAENKPDYESLSVLKTEYHTEEEFLDYAHVQMRELPELWNWQTEHLGKEYVLARTFQYLMQNDASLHPVDYLYYLEDMQ